MKLPTQDKIKKWGNYDLMVCLLCYGNEDSHDHLFFKCPYSSELWSKVMQNIIMDDNHSNLEGVIENFGETYNGNSIGSVVRRLCLAACVYFVWQERNNRIFKDERRKVSDLFNILCDTVKMRLTSLKMKNSKAIWDTEKEWDVKLHVV